jgi:hypothetical protein
MSFVDTFHVNISHMLSDKFLNESDIRVDYARIKFVC